MPNHDINLIIELNKSGDGKKREVHESHLKDIRKPPTSPGIPTLMSSKFTKKKKRVDETISSERKLRSGRRNPRNHGFAGFGPKPC